MRLIIQEIRAVNWTYDNVVLHEFSDFECAVEQVIAQRLGYLK